LEKADIVLFLLSPDFLASQYINSVEMKRALERVADASDPIVVAPIIVRDCLWEYSPLKKFETASGKGEIITLSKNIDKAWADVVRKIMKLINP
jgi:internalin A